MVSRHPKPLKILHFKDTNKNGYPDNGEKFTEKPFYYYGNKKITKKKFMSLANPKNLEPINGKMNYTKIRKNYYRNSFRLNANGRTKRLSRLWKGVLSPRLYSQRGNAPNASPLFTYRITTDFGCPFPFKSALYLARIPLFTLMEAFCECQKRLFPTLFSFAPLITIDLKLDAP